MRKSEQMYESLKKGFFGLFVERIEASDESADPMVVSEQTAEAYARLLASEASTFIDQAELKNQIANAKKYAAGLYKQLETSTGQSVTRILREANSSLERTMEVIKEADNRLSYEYGDALERIAAAETRISQAEFDIDTDEATIRAITEVIDPETGILTGAKIIVDGQTATLESFAEAVNTATGEITTLDSRMSAAEGTITTLADWKNVATGEIHAMEEQWNVIDATITTTIATALSDDSSSVFTGVSTIADGIAGEYKIEAVQEVWDEMDDDLDDPSNPGTHSLKFAQFVVGVNGIRSEVTSIEGALDDPDHPGTLIQVSSIIQDVDSIDLRVSSTETALEDPDHPGTLLSVGSIKVKADEIDILVDSNGNVRAGIIVQAINAQDPTSGSAVLIDADQIYLTGQVIADKITAGAGTNISGWTFGASSISNGNVSLDSYGNIKNQAAGATSPAWHLDANGAGGVANNHITWGSDGTTVIDGSVLLVGTSVATIVNSQFFTAELLASNDTLVKLKTDYPFFKPGKGLMFDQFAVADTPPNNLDLYVKIETIGGVSTPVLHSRLPIVSDSFISAGGISAGGGAGGGDTTFTLITGGAQFDNGTDTLDVYSMTTMDSLLGGKQPLSSDLTSIAALSSSAGLLRRNSNNTWSLDSSTYLTSADLSGYATQNWVGQQGYITGINSTMVTNALGYTPANSSSLGSMAYASTSSYMQNTYQVYLGHWVLEDIPKNKTQTGGIGWDSYESYPYAGGGFVTFDMPSSLRSLLMLFPSYALSEPPILFSSIDNGAWGNAHQLAWITSNVASATKLNTARTLWGRSFDGTANVSGTMSGATFVYFSSVSGIGRGDQITSSLGSEDIAIYANNGTNSTTITAYCSYFTSTGSMQTNGSMTVANDVIVGSGGRLYRNTNETTPIVSCWDGSWTGAANIHYLPSYGGWNLTSVVGINKTDPTWTLDVGGSIRCSSFISAGNHAYINGNEYLSGQLYFQTGGTQIAAASQITGGATTGDLGIYVNNGSTWATLYLWAGVLNYSSGGYINLQGGFINASERAWTTAPTWDKALYRADNAGHAYSTTIHYRPIVGSYDYVDGNGFGNTWSLGAFHYSNENCGMYLGFSWDGAAHDTFFYFYRNGSCTMPGALTTSGDQVISSDLSKKNIVSNLSYTLDQIAGAPAITFDWKDGRGHSFGSIAQYWKPICPEMVLGEEGNYSLAYAQGAFTNGIIIARETKAIKDKIVPLFEKYEPIFNKVNTHEQRINDLTNKLQAANDEIFRLNQELTQLKMSRSYGVE